jgi:hypothetical protein
MRMRFMCLLQCVDENSQHVLAKFPIARTDFLWWVIVNIVFPTRQQLYLKKSVLFFFQNIK